MVILHIAAITNNLFSGVCVAVPQHVKAQGNYADVGFVNITNVKIHGIENQLEYEGALNLEKYAEPFSSPDLVVFHETYRVDYLKIARYLRRRGIPYVIIPHGELRKEAQQKKHLKKVAANILLFNDFINHAAAIQCLSEKEYQSTHFGKTKFIATNGVEIPLKEKSEFHQENIQFVYIGRLEVHTKGLDLLIKALGAEADFLRENQCKFVLYGPDHLGRFAEVEALIRDHGVGDFVTLNHEIAGEEKVSALLESDIFIQTSRFEGMPMGILEALSYGIPCLVTRGTTLGEMIVNEDAGWMAETDVSGIAESIKTAVREYDHWERKGIHAKKFVERVFSWSVVSKEAIEEYSRIICGKKS